jgi:hypothetical protein
MFSARHYRRNLSLALALVAMTISQVHNPTADARSVTSIIAADITAEKQTLDSFGSKFTTLEKTISTLQKRTSITASELSSTKTSATTLKTQLSQVQQAIASIVRKLKASGEWQNYDATVNAQLDSKGQKLLSDLGGAKRLLEDFSSRTGSLGIEIDALVQPLNSRVASSGFAPATRGAFGFMPTSSSFVTANTATAPLPATLGNQTGRCIVRATRYILFGGFGRPGNTVDHAVCACTSNSAAETAACDASITS